MRRSADARVAKLADARDLKSRVLNRTYRFNSGPGHQVCEILRCAQDFGCGLPPRLAFQFSLKFVASVSDWSESQGRVVSFGNDAQRDQEHHRQGVRGRNTSRRDRRRD